MSAERQLYVHLLPSLVSPDHLVGGVAVVIDVLRAGTTAIHALANGSTAVLAIGDVEEARQTAGKMRAGKVVLGGERDGKPIDGFDLGNSPKEYTRKVCKDAAVVLTTTNGTRALLHAAQAERTVLAAFVNFSAVCEQLITETRPIHILCAGTDGEVTLEDTLLAGALVDSLCDDKCICNDSARVAWDCFEHHGTVLVDALRLSKGGVNLIELGYEKDILAAAEVDKFMIVPELKRSPLRLEVGSVCTARSRWPR